MWETLVVVFGGSWYSHAISTRTRVQADLDQVVVLGKVGGVEDVGLEVIVDQRLPGRGQAEDVEAVGVDEVLHLALRHVRRWTWVLQFEFIGVEVALSWWCYLRMFESFFRDGISCLLTLVSIPISHPAMFTPPSQTAFACATKADTTTERSIVLRTEVLEERLSSEVTNVEDWKRTVKDIPTDTCLSLRLCAQSETDECLKVTAH